MREKKLLDRREFTVAIPLERPRDTRLRHQDATVSMARLGPDTATQSFVICVGDQPELDFAGKRNPDGQGSPPRSRSGVPCGYAEPRLFGARVRSA